MTAPAIATIGDNNPPADREILLQRLQENNVKLLENTDALLGAAERLPDAIEDGDEDMADKVTTFISQITRTVKALDSTRVAEKEPFLTQGRVVDTFFKRPIDALDIAKRKANRPLTEYLTRKAGKERAEREAAAELARQQAADQLAAAEAATKPMEQAEKLEQAVATEQSAVRLQQQAEARPAELAKVRSSTGATAGLRTRWVGTVIDRDALDLNALRQHIPADALQKALTSYVAAGGRELKGATIKEISEAVTR